MINSDTFGMTFWLDSNNDFCYCPTFNDNTPDKDNWGYVTEWDVFDDVDFNELFDIHYLLVTEKAQQFQEVV